MPIIKVLLPFTVLLLVYLLRIRPWQLAWGSRPSELGRSMPGDDIVSRPSFNATRAVTIDASAYAIYPWIIQIGINRAGWYSYDWLDNLGRPSATRLIPQHQNIHQGQLIPLSPDGKQGLYVLDFKENEWILWGDKAGDTTWLWSIYPEGEQASRLVTRVRVRYRWLSPVFFFNLLIEFADIVMMRKCMLGIKQRAEALASHAEPQA